MGSAYKIQTGAAVLIAVLLAGCPSQPRRPAPPPGESVPVPEQPRIQREGRPFKVDSAQSLLTVLVFRGGPLARAGHNHVVASHDLTGVAYVPEDPTRASFDVALPVGTLVVDEEDLRSQEGPEFPPGVPEEAREGTRRNMLGEALLNADRYPQIGLQSESIQRTPEGGLQAQVRVIVRDQAYALLVPLTYQIEGDELRVQGETPLRQSDVGLTPFSLFGGALRVLDGIEVKFRIVARAEPAR